MGHFTAGSLINLALLSSLAAQQQSEKVEFEVVSIKPGDPGGSEVIKRMNRRSRFPPSMPPLASERIDEHGLAVVRAWIEDLR